MSKKLHSKLLSIILVISICCATLCGSIIGANAAMADYNGTYTITVGDDKNAVPFAANKVTATVTFELPAGFASGEFTIDTPTQFYSGVSDLKIVDGTVKPIYNGVEFSADNFEDCYLTDGVVSFADYDGYLYTSLTFEYTYNMVSYVTCGASYNYNDTSDYKGTRYPVSITVDGSTFGVDTDYVNASFSVSDASDEHFHSHFAWYDSTNLANEKTTNGFVEQKDGKHYVSTAICNYCQYFNSEYNYPQVYPDYTEFDTAVKMYNGTIGWMGISGVTVDYKDNGTLDVNVHAYSQNYSGNAFLLICDENGNELYRTGTVNNGTSIYKDNGFPTDEKCFTISDFSAKHIDTELLITVINLYNESNEMAVHHSRTMPFKLADYCTSVIGGVNGTELGNVVWGDASEEKMQADKEVAAALCYYSAAIDESVFEHVTANNGTLPGDTAGTTVNKGSDVWAWRSELSDTAEKGWGWFDPDLTVNDSTKEAGTETNPYIINNAEQLMYVLYSLGPASSGKYYKVSDDLGALYMTVNAANLVGKSAAEVKEYFENTTDSLKAQPNGNTEGFQGTLDGNGVTIYGFNGVNNYYGGFIQFVDGNVTIKNLSIKNSYYKYGSNPSVGGIVGTVVSESGATLTIENCGIEDCYIESGVYFGAGSIVGKAKQNTVNIKNCIVADNTVNSTAVPERMGPIAYTGTSWGTMTASISDSIFINNNPYNQSNYGLSYPDAFTNVYTNVDMTNVLCGSSPWVYEETQVKQLASLDDIKGVNATTNTSLDFENDWIAVDGGYPELSAFHKMQTVSTGNSSGHTEKCVIKIDGTSCTVKSPTVTPHDLTVEKEVDGVKYNTCSVCGWGKKVVGTTIVPNNKTTATWDGTTPTTNTMSGGGTQDDPYIVKTAEQMAYVAKYATSGYYEVDPEIGAFNMGSYSMNATADEVKTAGAGSKYLGYTSTVFSGTFDGKGVIIYGLTASGYHGGLFSTISGGTVKNLTIQASYFSSTDGAAGSIASLVGVGTSTIENCVVKNCYFEKTSVNSISSNGCGVGTVVGRVNNQAAYITINNCFIKDNSFDESITTHLTYGVIGSAAWNLYNEKYDDTSTTGDMVVSNTIVLGSSPYGRAASGATEYSNTCSKINYGQTYSNVYTDYPVSDVIISGETWKTSYSTDQMQQITDLNTIKGAGVVSELGFDDAVWFATDSYPELHAMHNMVMQYTNDDSHKLVCADVIDGTACTTCGVEAAHADAGNSTCECGFVIEEQIDTLALIREKFPDNADAIISILLGSDEEETLYETAFASNVLFKNAYSADYEEINGTIDDCCLYATSLNLKTTPHIAFTFAFQGEYRENKSNVTATFTCGDTVTTVTANEMINNEGAGRYHLYRFKDLPVVDLRKPISVEVKYDDNTLVKGTYSAAGYAINAMDLGAQYKWHAEAAKALVYYSEMLAARYGA